MKKKFLVQTDEGIVLDKGLYLEAVNRGVTFQQLLEEKSPTPVGMQLTAFERQLMYHGIKVKGLNADTVEKFFQTTDSAILFPAYIAETIREGIMESNRLPEIIAVTTQIDSDVYKALEMADEEADRELRKVGEAEDLPEIELFTKEKEVNIADFGALLVASYKAMAKKKLPVFEVFLRRIGAQIALSMFSEALDVLINGDGNNNAAEVIGVGTTGKINYEDMVRFWTAFDEPYEANIMVCDKEMIIGLLLLDEFKDPQAGFKFQATGELINPMGAKLLKSKKAPAGMIVGIDKRYALEQVIDGKGILTESDKLIQSQLERTAITISGGFAKLMAGACKILDINVQRS